MRRALVAYASKMDTTREIAQAIGDELRAAGLDVDVRAAGNVYEVDSYRVVVVGSALYSDKWQRAAVRLLKQHAAALAARQVWLFHSGPCDDTGRQVAPPANVARLTAQIGADPPVTFGGRLTSTNTRGWHVTKASQTPMAGDFRDWARIRAWAKDIADDAAQPRGRASAV